MPPYGGLALQGLRLIFLKFSRDDETQSDELGLRYMTRNGYDPHEMPKMFVTLDRISAAQGEGGRIPAWASTIPTRTVAPSAPWTASKHCRQTSRPAP